MKYFGVIDHEHLDNAVFLTALAQALDRFNYSEHHYILLHGDSEYTDRIIQSGVMREEAMRRSIRGLNNRLVALLADEGISAIGLNGFQRKLIVRENEEIRVDTDYLDGLPTSPVWLISSLIQDLDRDERVPLALSELTSILCKSLAIDRVYLFARTEDNLFDEVDPGKNHPWDTLDEDFIETYIPADFQQYRGPIRLTTAKNFGDTESEQMYIDIG